MQSTSATLAAALQPPRPVSTIGKLSTSSDNKRHTRKENNFVLKYGQRHHSYDSEKAPYPLSYDRHVLELESLDNHFTKHLRSGSVSFVNHEEVPERVLDLGCGMGTWVIDAAKQWPDCELVGFDLVNIQIPVAAVDPLLAKRITWVHGNFLTTRLPFEEDEFDHVHIQSIAQGVPENKWDNLFDEINRVLRPGGSVEIIEDDAVFPYLPRWFTAPMRARPRRTTFPDGSQRGYPSLSDIPGHDIPSHDHALLESLYNAVFQHRFINMRPSSLLPNYFISYFRHCTLGPVISYPMPAIPPLQPLPTQIVNAHSKDMSPENADSRISMFFPVITSDMTSAIPSVRPPSMSFSSTISSCSTVQSSTYDSSLSSLFSFSGRGKSGSVSTTASNGPSPPTESSLTPSDPEKLSSERLARTPTPVPKLYAPYMLESSSTDLTAVPSIPPALFSKDRLVSLNERSLAMHLFRSYQIVLACREALWEELKDRIRNRREELTPFGWEDDDDFEETQNRKKFEKLLERYQNDMQARCALWCSLNNIGWPFPPREPLSKAELIEEERMREAMLEARQQAPLEEQQVPCRTTRVLVGFKPQ